MKSMGEWIAILKELPDGVLSYNYIGKNKLMKAPPGRKYHFLEQIGENAYVKTEIFYKSLEKEEGCCCDLNRAITNFGRERFNFINDLKNKKYNDAYNKLIWLLGNRVNDAYNNELILYASLLGKLLNKNDIFDKFALKIEDLNLKELFGFKNTGEYYWNYLDEFQKAILIEDWNKVRQSIAYFKVFSPNKSRNSDECWQVNTILAVVTEIIKQISCCRKNDVKPLIFELEDEGKLNGKNVYTNTNLRDIGFVNNSIYNENLFEQVVVDGVKGFKIVLTKDYVEETDKFITFLNYVKNEDYLFAYLYLINNLNDSKIYDWGKLYNDIYCILLEKILGVSALESKVSEMRTRKYNVTSEDKKLIEVFDLFLSSVRNNDFETAYKALGMYVSVNPNLFASRSIYVLKRLICKTVGRENLDKNTLMVLVKPLDIIISNNKISSNNINFSLEKNGTELINGNITLLLSDCLVSNEQLRTLLKDYDAFCKTKIFSYRRTFRIDDNGDAVVNFRQTVRNGSYCQAFDYVGKCLCKNIEDNGLKLYSKILIGLVRKFDSSKYVVLDDKIVSDLIDNKKYDRLMEIFKVVGKDNLDSKYYRLYDKVEFLVMKFEVMDKTPEIKGYKYSFNDNAIEYLNQEERPLINKECYKLFVRKR